MTYDDQADESKSLFNQFLNAIFSINGNSSQEEITAFNQLVQRVITAKPILARIVQGNGSLLSVTCDHMNKLVHPAIKCLIEAYPSALLWETNGFGGRIIHNIAGHPSHCVLMPWIATNYQWVLDHNSLEHSPLFDLLTRYANRGEETGCTTAIIKQFFEAYPQGLTQVNEDGCTPLHAIVEGSVECEADLFKWMAEQCPSNMLQTDINGWTPLHLACDSLTDHLGDDSSDICNYLIEQCPKSVREPDNTEPLPIHYLHNHCQHRPVKEVVVCLLREYPESYDMAARTIDGDPMPAPSSIPFIQRIKLLLDEERELKENVAYLQEVSGLFRDAVDGTQTPSSLASSTCDAFVNWATLTSVQRLKAKMEQVSMQLQHECNVDEDDDEDAVLFNA